MLVEVENNGFVIKIERCRVTVIYPAMHEQITKNNLIKVENFYPIFLVIFPIISYILISQVFLFAESFPGMRLKV